MAEWIKIEHVMPDKPEVSLLAADLNIDHDAAVGKLIRFWIWLDQQAESGDAISVTEALLDRVTNCEGFSKSLSKVGWLRFKKNGIAVPNFDRHNGKTAKKRALTRDRMQRKRDADSVTNASPEGEGEGEGESVPSTFSGGVLARSEVANGKPPEAEALQAGLETLMAVWRKCRPGVEPHVSDRGRLWLIKTVEMEQNGENATLAKTLLQKRPDLLTFSGLLQAMAQG